MPDVTRSDSQRSETSLRPRVSFNRDVHVKRIVPREGNRILGALSGDGEGHLVKSPVRKERLSRSREQLAKEAAEVLQQADKLDCVVKDGGSHPAKFYTLPTRKKRHPEYSQSSLDRRTRRRNSDELSDVPPKKPPRTFAAHSKTPPRTSVFGIFKGGEPKKSNLRRSVSDASNSRSKSDDAQFRKRSGSDETEENLRGGGKKQLSPIIEVAQREDYFTPNENRTNPDEHVTTGRELSVTEKLKEYIDEIDTELYKESGVRIKPQNADKKPPEIVIIDVDEADQISTKKNGKKTKSLGKKLKSLAAKSKTSSKTKDNYVKKPGGDAELNQPQPPASSKSKDKMIHSSQKPTEKLLLTRGRTVDNMVKRLSHDPNSSPPPKTSIMITPNVSVQHNNNQPFSYTRGHSPEKTFLDEPRPPTNPIIYAQVVCGAKNNPANKQTVHATYVNGKKNVPHSDSDEGLGYEENSGFGHRKYEAEKTVTHFGDERFEKNIVIGYNDPDRFDEEFPITPKFKTTTYNGFGGYGDAFNEKTLFIDSSNRGRGDGMDAKRRESLTEPPEQGLFAKCNGSSNNINGRSDLSARRDLLESRITRKLGEKTLRTSPEYSPRPANYNSHNNVYVTTETSRYYRSGSASPVGFQDKYTEEVVVDKVGGERYKTETRTRKYFGGENRHQSRHSNNFDSEPKSFDSQISDYRSSPEATSHNYKSSHQDKYVSKTVRQQIYKDRDLYKSNPEINRKSYKYEDHPESSYHDSLKRVPASGKYFERTDSERKDKFGDSGIENDFRRDSGENFKKREVFNESEDEGFASSLLIASERQHTEDNFATRKRSNRSNQRDSRERDDPPYRHAESSVEVKYRKERNEYAPRERSIDDGSHFDPRIDKEVERATLKKGTEKKPPKPEKKSGLEKMKQLFSRDSKKKKEKERSMVREESLRARYTEYRGSREELGGPKARKKDVGEMNSSFDYSNRRRLSTPSPSPTRQQQQHHPHPHNEKPENVHGSWFKSLDRLARKKSKKDEKEFEEETAPSLKQPPQKNLRFFGDTDIESNDSLRKPPTKIRPALAGNTRERTRSQSTRDLHNISEERASPEIHRSNHKSMLNISDVSERDLKGSRLSLKPPASPNHRHRDASRSRDDRSRRRKNEVSSVESSTEGDSSQQSQRSVVYLHAATVGDIPGPGYLRSGRRAASREELASNGSTRVQPQTKTLSRSFSVLAPWRPKHYRETMDIDYTQYPKPVKNGKYEQKTSKNGSSRKENSSTLKKKAQETKRNNQSASTLNRRSRSKENVSSTLKRTKEETPKSVASSTLYKKKERQPKENTRYNSSKEEKKFSAKTLSMESLGGTSRASRRSREESREVSRSISMPRDPEKSAGWFKMSKKSKKSDSAQRL